MVNTKTLIVLFQTACILFSAYYVFTDNTIESIWWMCMYLILE